MATVNENLFHFDPGNLPRNACIVIIHTEWNEETVGRMLQGCLGVLSEYGMTNYKVLQVPGAFEIPFAVRHFWETYNNKFEKPQVFITLGCVLRGDTPHFEYVSRAVTDGVLQLNLTLPVPVIFGVLTVENQHQADERTGGSQGNKGAEAAITALKMISLKYSS